MTRISIGALVFLLPLAVVAQDGLVQVKIQSIRVQGSRLPAASVIKLLELKIGQEANEKTVRAALQRVTLSGLFASIDFNYESEPGSKEVELVLDVHDQMPLLPAAIHVPKAAEEEIWQWLKAVDPLFTRELPPTDGAIRMYSNYIMKYLQTKDRNDFILGRVLGDAAGKPVSIEFIPGKLREAPGVRR
jgi:hypothetical protein